VRTLFISSSIGLGHAGRDLAIANELRRLRPDVEIDWLAGDPATRFLEQAGERMLPESSVIRETGVAEANAGDFSLNLVGYVTHAARQWARVARTILRLIDRHEYEFVVGDETYELTIAFALRPALKPVPFAIIYDFFGVDAMSGNPFERVAVYALNYLWGGGRRGTAPPFDLVLFVGEPEDVPDRPLGARLPNRRAYATRHFAFIGYIVDFDATELRRNRSSGRAALGYDERPLIICSVGGTAVGADLLRLCGAAYPHLLSRVPDARMLLVCGPRIDPATIPAPPGVEVLGFVPRLYEHFAACDVAVVQAGGTTTLELTALRRPFVYFPLDSHFEQNLAVVPRLRRHGAGERRDYESTSPQALADLIARQLDLEPAWQAIPTDGARRAAELIAAQLPPTGHHVGRGG
jgi:predicted glycosyltransferase